MITTMIEDITTGEIEHYPQVNVYFVTGIEPIHQLPGTVSPNGQYKIIGTYLSLRKACRAVLLDGVKA